MNYSPVTWAADDGLERTEAFLALLAEIRARREEFMAQRKVDPGIIDKLRRLGIYRAMVSKKFGGDERSPMAFCRAIEAISAADGSVGWVASFGAAATYLAALPEPTLRQVYANGPDVVFAGGLFPLQPVRRVPGGVLVKGRWKFGSGSPGADLIGVGISIEDDTTGGLPRVAVMPAAKVEIRENWDVIGLQGTGSHDLAVDDEVVPEEWTFIRGGAPSVDAPVNRYPTLALSAQVLAVVGLGIARSALDQIGDMAGGRVSITGAPRMVDRPHVQIEVGKAEASLRAARAFFYEATEQLWEKAVSAELPSPQDVTLVRLAASHAARTGAQVSRVCYELAGTTAIYNGHGLARAMCDSSVVAQHAFLNDGTYQSGGRIMLGLPAAPGYP